MLKHRRIDVAIIAVVVIIVVDFARACRDNCRGPRTGPYVEGAWKGLVEQAL